MIEKQHYPRSNVDAEFIHTSTDMVILIPREPREDGSIALTAEDAISIMLRFLDRRNPEVKIPEFRIP